MKKAPLWRRYVKSVGLQCESIQISSSVEYFQETDTLLSGMRAVIRAFFPSFFFNMQLVFVFGLLPRIRSQNTTKDKPLKKP